MERMLYNKVNRWGLELATYNITFEWISGAKNKAADCLSCLVELPLTTSAPINMLSVLKYRWTQLSILEAKLNNALHQILPQHNQVLHLTSASTPDPTPKSLTADRLKALL